MAAAYAALEAAVDAAALAALRRAAAVQALDRQADDLEAARLLEAWPAARLARRRADWAERAWACLAAEERAAWTGALPLTDRAVVDLEARYRDGGLDQPELARRLRAVADWLAARVAAGEA